MRHSLRGPVPPPRVDLVGRDEECDALVSALTSDAGSRLLHLHGDPGAGTSALAAEVARQAGECLRLPVHWLPVGAAAGILPPLPLLRLAAQLDVPRLRLASRWKHLTGTEVDSLDFAGDLVHSALRERPAVVVLDGIPNEKTGDILSQPFRRTRAVALFTSYEDWPLADEGLLSHGVRPLPEHAVRELFHRKWDQGPSYVYQLHEGCGGLPGFLPLARSARLSSDWIPPSRTGDLHYIAHRALEWRCGELLNLLEKSDRKEFDTRSLGPPVMRHLFAEPGERVEPLVAELLRVGLAHPLSPTRFRLVTDRPRIVRYTPPDQERYRYGPTRLARTPQRHRQPLLDAAHHQALGTAHAFDGIAGDNGDEPAPDLWEASLGLAESADDHLDLLALESDSWEPNTHELANLLARYFVRRGDHHRLAALHLVRTRALHLRAPAFPLSQSTAARQLGAPLPALRTLRKHRPFTQTFLELALCQRDLGDHINALRTVADGLREYPDTPALLSLKGELLTDQGRYEDAARALDTAITLHNREGGRHGLAVANLRRGRLGLLAPRAMDGRDTEQWLGTAQLGFEDSGDERGLAWTATALGRLNLTQETFDRALAAHRATEDVRGVAWTRYYSALALADSTARGPVGSRERRDAALLRLTEALELFKKLGDRLGQAWALHQLAVLLRERAAAEVRPGSAMDADLVEELRRLWDRAFQLFMTSGCLHGQAWTLLEQGLHLAVHDQDDPGRAHRLLTSADDLFADLGDTRGRAWTTYLLALVNSRIDRPAAPGPDPSFGPLLQRAMTSGPRVPEPAAHATPSHPVPPLRAVRDVLLPYPLGDDHEPPAPTASLDDSDRCRIVLDLLDDGPGIRLLLRVVPGPRHPWATGETPWLTATAAPRTAVSVEPVGATLRPSASPRHGAEFGLEPHRPGVHILRFTVAHADSGTVLQQVETEIELPESDRPHGRTGPVPHHAERT
ncbi:hypothetical protein GCM10010329_03610 [Streptomyces spiroverticillatus]|uniref:Tetratricopeptide repeat protein n=1 Tax=Streptomyces finlayi TaxID=67296 RepID=A0A918WSH0_9ACTN|nr:hypothetical protein [Streptomyces finlayi]GGZ86986.1 hypothetical protein GCM10010329_03610 [Streptomyces spiroverticillatus]GHC78392.1 hypothetical protein GCM10010334_03590 [Streptomyces finlayi]